MMQLRRRLILLSNDTSPKILHTGVILYHSGTSYYEYEQENGCVTILYKMTTPTTVLYPAGIIPTSGNVIVPRSASLFVFDESKTPFNYVNENTASSGYNRWAQDQSGAMTEYSYSWTLTSNYYYIQFSLDMRYLDRAYMYDKTSGQVWFAGKNTPYYGKKIIAQ